VDPSSFHHLFWRRQDQRPSRRARRCLLKGCEQWFTPAYPQARYCSEECRRAAQRWRRVKASRRYRASPGGREQRREQNRQYRLRRRARSTAADDEPKAREGKRPAPNRENFAERMCDRPGCYVIFRVRHDHSCQRFCSVACRLALRRVLDREARYRARRRRWRRQRLNRRSRPPDTS
jgi:hypothetical protein